jgi:hypothetical protein
MGKPTPTFKTYSRRPRSVTARPYADAALLVSTPTRLNINLTDEPRDGSVARTPSMHAPGPASEAERDTIQATQKKMKRAKVPQVAKSVEEAKAATQTFLASVRQALQVPLATLPDRQVNPCAVPGSPTSR